MRIFCAKSGQNTQKIRFRSSLQSQTEKQGIRILLTKIKHGFTSRPHMAKRQKRPISVVGKRFFSIISMRNMAKVCHWALGLHTQTIFSAPAPTTFRRVVTSQGTRCKSQVPTIQHHSQSRVMRRAFSATDHADSGGAARWMEWVLRLCRCTHTTWQETPGVSHRAHGSRPNGPVVGDSSRVVKDLTHTSLSCGSALSARGLAIGDTSSPTQEPAHFEPTCRK